MKKINRLFETPQIEALPFVLQDIITVSGDGSIPGSENGEGPIKLPIIPG